MVHRLPVQFGEPSDRHHREVHVPTSAGGATTSRSDVDDLGAN